MTKNTLKSEISLRYTNTSQRM